jgi:hypothetical protein
MATKSDFMNSVAIGDMTWLLSPECCPRAVRENELASDKWAGTRYTAR